MAKGTWKIVSHEEWQGRRTKGRHFLQSANRLANEHFHPDDADAVVTTVIMAVIAYADALTNKFASVQNIQDHAGISNTLCHAMRDRVPKEQLRRLRELVAAKDQVQYDHRIVRPADALEVLEQASRFAAWAEHELLKK